MEVQSDKLLIILPAYNPPRELTDLVQTLRKHCTYPILIIDDGSLPMCQAIFEHLRTLPRCTVIVHPENRGKGQALKTAFQYALQHYPHLTGAVTADADGQHAVTDILHCAQELLQFPDQLILGVRNFRQSTVPWKSRFGNYLASGMFRWLWGINLSDSQTGLRGLPASFMQIMLRLPGRRYEYETCMLIACCNPAGHIARPVREIPIATIYSAGNRNSHFRTLIDSWHIFRTFYRNTPGNILSFAGSGILSALLDQGLFVLLFYLVLPAKHIPRLFLATAIARTAALIFNYLINRNMVFKTSGNYFDRRSLIGYLLLSGGIMLCSYALVKAVSFLLPEANIWCGKLIADSLLFLLSYYLQKRIIFARSPHLPQ